MPSDIKYSRLKLLINHKKRFPDTSGSQKGGGGYKTFAYQNRFYPIFINNF